MAHRKTNPAKRKNLVGAKVRELRILGERSQSAFVGLLQRKGWDIERTTLAKIELGRRCVTDFEIEFLADALDVTPNVLFGVG